MLQLCYVTAPLTVSWLILVTVRLLNLIKTVKVKYTPTGKSQLDTRCKFGENVSNTPQEIVLTMFRDANTDARKDERDKNSIHLATLCWVEWEV